MLQEIGKLFQFAISDSQGKQKRNLFFLALALFIFLLILNIFLLNDFISDDLVVRFQQAKYLFINNLSPYDNDVQNFIKTEIIKLDLDPDPGAFDLESALPQLVYYLPFSFIPLGDWATSLYMTVSMFSFLVAVYLLFKISEKNISGINLLFFSLSICSLFYIRTIFSGKINAITFLIIVYVVHLIQKNKNLMAGVLLGIVTFEIVTIPIVLIILYVGLLKSKRTAAIVWAFIANSLVTLAMMIFDPNWLLGWLRNLFLMPHTVPFLTYPEALMIRYGLPAFQLFSIISLLLIIWISYEVIQNPFSSPQAWLWILGFGSIINYFLIIQSSDVAAIFILIAQTIIFSIWKERTPKNKLIILIILLGLITIIISAIYLTPAITQKTRFFDIFMIVTSFFFVLNLYWLKRWAIIPFDYEKLNWNS